jgi:DNA-binding winged helix-turn-helix (wHTH) protein/tetratricopeptide (TPR) repeat protein
MQPLHKKAWQRAVRPVSVAYLLLALGIAGLLLWLGFDKETFGFVAFVMLAGLPITCTAAWWFFRRMPNETVADTESDNQPPHAEPDLLRGFCLGDYSVRPLVGQIDGGAVGPAHVQPKVMDVLLMLARHPNEVVERERLLNTVWGRATTDEVLHRCISELRARLGDERNNPRYIQTIPKRGYRLLVAPVFNTDSPQGRRERETESFEVPVWTSSESVAAAVVFLVLALGLSAAYIAAPSSKAFAFASRDRVVVGDFVNQTTEEGLGDALAMALRIGIGQSRYAIPLPQSEIAATLQRMTMDASTSVDRAVGLEISQRQGAKALVIGSVAEIGTAYVISTEIIDALSGRTVFAEQQIAGNEREILPVLDTIARATRRRLGESLAEIERSTQPLERVTTRDLDALKAYSLAIETGSQDLERAIDLLEHAVAVDHQFSMAHSMLATLVSIASDDQETAARHRSLALQHADRLTNRERVFIQAQDSITGTPREMIRAWSLMKYLYPEDGIAYRNLASIYWEYYNDFERARDEYLAAIGADDSWKFVSHQNLGHIRIGLGDFEAALQSFRTATELASGQVLDGGLANALVALGRHEEAEYYIQSLTPDASTSLLYLLDHRLITSLVDQGRLAEARERSAVALWRARTLGAEGLISKTWAATIAILERTDRVGFLEALNDTAAREMSLIDTAKGYSPSLHLAVLGKIAARNGELDLAREILEQVAPRLRPSEFLLEDAYLHILEGEILLADGKVDDALSRFGSVLRNGDLFQLHESLARGYSAAGDFDSARREYEWILAHRGLPLSEATSSSYVTEFSTLDWCMASFELAALYEQMGNRDRSVQYYREFVSHWVAGDASLPSLRLARELAAEAI